MSKPLSGGHRNTRAVDTPLRRWRLSQRLSREILAQRCHVSIFTIKGYEQGKRRPRKEELEALIRETDLSADALMRPEQFLQAHPDYLSDYAMMNRGRPRHGRPPHPS